MQQTYGAQKVVFITGAAGFIGSNFLEYMFNKYPHYQFLVLDALTYAGTLDNIDSQIKNSERFEFLHGSVTSKSDVERFMSRADFVVHFAAETHVTRSIYDDKCFFDTDVEGTRVMMRSLLNNLEKVERFIHISTSEVLGTAQYEPMNEQHPLNPQSPYAAAKTGADRLVYAYCQTYNVPAVILRPFNNYGPRQHIEKLIPRFITRAIEGKPLPIHGAGTQQRDWIHTYDTARAIDLALHIPDFSTITHQVIHLGSGKPLSVLEIAQTSLHHFNYSYDFLEFVDNRPGQVDRHISSTQKAYELLGWKAEIPFEQGLQQTINWYLNNKLRWQKMDASMYISAINKTIQLP